MKNVKKKLSIAHLHWGFPPIIGGVETHLTILLPTFVDLGHRVSLLTCSSEGYNNSDHYKGVEITREPIMDLNWLATRGFQGIEKQVRKIFEKFIDKQKPDIIHAHNMHYFSKTHARILEEIANKHGIPLFLTAHNVWDDGLFFELSTKIKWTHIIAVSHFIKKELIGIGCHHRNVTTVHHGIDPELFRPDINPSKIYGQYPQLKNRRVIFHPARMGLAKGCDVSIKALRLIKEQYPEVILVLAGTKNIVDWELTQQKDIAYMIDLVERFNLKDHILIDSYPLEDIPYMYAAAEVCVYPSTAFEPFGLTMLEALASGKPMIVTNAGGMPEIIRDGINGFVIPMKGFEELASRVMSLFSNPELRDRFGTIGREMVESSFTNETMAKATLNIYFRHLGKDQLPQENTPLEQVSASRTD